MSTVITIVIPYNPLVELSGLQNLAKRWADALVAKGYETQIFTVGQSGRHGEVSIVGFPGIVPLCAAVLGLRDTTLVHWMEVWPTRAGAYLQYLTAFLARLSGRTHTLATGTPGNLRSRGWLPGVRHRVDRIFSGFVVPNRDFLAEYEACGIPASRVTVVPQGLLASEPFRPLTIDQRTQVCRRLSLDPDRRHVLYLGRMVERKRPHDFIAAAEIALAAGCDAQFVLVGESWHHEDSIDGAVHEAVREMGSPDVIIHPHTNSPWEYLGVANLVVLTSERDGEAFVVLEALASGATVLVPDIPVLRNFGAPARVPLHVFPLGDVGALALAISKLLGTSQKSPSFDGGPRFVAESRRLEMLIEQYTDRFARRRVDESK